MTRLETQIAEVMIQDVLDYGCEDSNVVNVEVNGLNVEVWFSVEADVREEGNGYNHYSNVCVSISSIEVLDESGENVELELNTEAVSSEVARELAA